MKIELKNIKINESFSKETTCFKADLYVEGIKCAVVENKGHGGNTHIGVGMLKEHKNLLTGAELYCAKMPKVKSTFAGLDNFDMDLEYFIDKLVEKERILRFEKRANNKIEKLCSNGIVYGVKGKHYFSRNWKGYTIETLKQHPKGIEILKAAIADITSKLKEGETIWNTNLNF